MSFIDRFFPTKTVITSATIRAEITKAQAEIAAYRAKIEGMTDGIAAMTDEQHVAAETNVAALRRAIARLELRIATLDNELPAVLAAEEATAKAEADAALIKRAEAARKANEKESAALLREYDSHAAAIGDVLARLARDRRRNRVGQHRTARKSRCRNRCQLPRHSPDDDGPRRERYARTAPALGLS